MLEETIDGEFFEERAAIREYDGGMSRSDAERHAARDVEKYRHECEVRWVVGLATLEARRTYLSDVEKVRGKAAADRLRDDVRIAWEKR